jgi:hypothetical protein
MNLKDRYTSPNSPILFTVLRQINPVHTLKLYFFKV